MECENQDGAQEHSCMVSHMHHHTMLVAVALAAVSIRGSVLPNLRSESVVNTTSGAVRGRCASESGCVFYGVPFAQPPVKELRFAAPKPLLVPAGGVRDATRPGPACYQTPQDPVTVQSEDCLTVDVWVPPRPALPTEEVSSLDSLSSASTSPVTRPVLVFFYGGGALSGASSWYNFSKYAADGYIVFAANYRVGPLGFMALEALSSMSPSGSSGNYGLMDCELAVRFAVANAARFGGDGGSITIMGQSSGATMVWGLVGRWWASSISPRPFQRAIILSGSPNISMDRPRAELQNAPLPVALGCAAPDGRTLAVDVVRCLREAPAEAISYGHRPINTTWQEYDALTWGLPGPEWRNGFPLPGVVIVDGDFIKAPLADALRRPATGVPIDLLLSNVAAEDDLAPNHDFSGNSTSGPIERFFDEHLSPWGGPGYGSSLLRKYGFADMPPQQAYMQAASTLGVVCGGLHLLQQAALGTPAANLYYIAVADGPTTPQILGVAPGYVSRYAYHQCVSPLSLLLRAAALWSTVCLSRASPPPSTSASPSPRIPADPCVH